MEGSCRDADYGDRLPRCCRPTTILSCSPPGRTPSAGQRRREELAGTADFWWHPPALADLNDKETVHQRCLALGLPVPQEYDGPPDRYPVVVKPRCGEQFGLKSWERYTIARRARRPISGPMRPCPSTVGRPLCRKRCPAPVRESTFFWIKQPAGVCLLPPTAAGIPCDRGTFHLLRELL